MYQVCQVNQEGYESDKEMYNQNPSKLEKALNEAKLVKLTKERHFKETMYDLKFDAILEDVEERKFKDCVSRLCFDQKDSQIRQERIRRELGRIENKLNHLTTMAEGEARRDLLKRKEEYLRKQRG